jgi:hypothetical protein
VFLSGSEKDITSRKLFIDVFTSLAHATRKQTKDGALPDFIVPLLMKVAKNPEEFLGREELVVKLMERVLIYETYQNLLRKNGLWSGGYLLDPR